MDRNSTYLWMKDLLEHIGNCYDYLDVADGRSQGFLADAIRRDLQEFRQLCSSLGTHANSASPLRRSA